MSEKPILFSGEMVRAILELRKTQTRRVIKPQPFINSYGVWQLGDSTWNLYRKPLQVFVNVNPRYTVGDKLWVRETFYPYADTGAVWFKAGIPEFRGSARTGKWLDFPYKLDRSVAPPSDFKWKPSIFMPRWASRITLRVNQVRVERVQDISDKDAIAEGIKVHVPVPGDGLPAPRLQFKNLWDSINAIRGYGWDSNPWVWVIDFEEVKQ